jgi:hypothetical protein
MQRRKSQPAGNAVAPSVAIHEEAYPFLTLQASSKVCHSTIVAKTLHAGEQQLKAAIHSVPDATGQHAAYTSQASPAAPALFPAEPFCRNQALADE